MKTKPSGIFPAKENSSPDSYTHLDTDMAEYDITFLRIDYIADHLYNVDKRAVFHAHCGDVRHGFNNHACVRVQPLISQLIEVHQLELCHGGRQFRIWNRTAAYKIDDLQGTAVCQQAQNAKSLAEPYGRRTRAVIVTDSGHIILSAVQPETVANRLVQTDDEDEE